MQAASSNTPKTRRNFSLVSSNLSHKLHIIYFVILNVILSYSDPNGGGCPKSPACGAMSPAYLLKPHPDNMALGESKGATICYTTGNTCCGKTQQIMIKKCKDFFIYKLPRACIKRARYCGNRGTLLGFKSKNWIKKQNEYQTEFSVFKRANFHEFS